MEHKDCDFFCKNCKKLLPLTIDDYFSLFDQPRTFDIDTSRLEKTYKAHQRQIHPDKFFEASKKELKTADSVSCCVNEGYRTLSDPMKRAMYMLKLYKMNEVGNVPQEFLMKCMKIHQQIAGTTDTTVLVKLLKEIQGMIKDEQSNLSKCLKISNGKLTDGEGAADAIARMKYLNRIRDNIRDKLPLDMM